MRMAKTIKKVPTKKAKAKAENTPYYLSKARLKGYLTIKDCEVEFKPGLNIIIGKNGVGKTNFSCRCWCFPPTTELR